MTARADAFAPPTATFPLHDVTDVFAKRRDLSNLTALTRRLPRQTVFQIAKLDTIPSAGSRISGAKSQKMVEPDGIEPTTSCLQSTRSPN